jgi:hypothetical protein
VRIIDSASLEGIGDVVDEGESCVLIDDVGERRRDEFCTTSQCGDLWHVSYWTH